MSFNPKISAADQSSTSDGAVKELQVSAGPARAYSITAYNGTDTDAYLLVFDAAAAPADGVGSKPKLVAPLYKRSNGGFDWKDGKIFTAGIYVCVSSTDVSKTLIGGNTAIIDATWRKQQ
jgi:hypothetical protein